jgi:hypothetical protein
MLPFFYIYRILNEKCFSIQTNSVEADGTLMGINIRLDENVLALMPADKEIQDLGAHCGIDRREQYIRGCQD